MAKVWSKILKNRLPKTAVAPEPEWCLRMAKFELIDNPLRPLGLFQIEGETMSRSRSEVLS